MKQSGSGWGWLARQLAYLLVGTLLFACLLSLVLDRAGGEADAGPDWASPKVMTLKRVSAIDSLQREPNFLSNLDCTPMEYRLPNSGTVQTGCFMATAFGLMDADSEMVVFNGTDEGLPLLPYASGQVSVPWPQAGGLIALEPASTGGAYVGFYRNPIEAMQDQRDASARLTGKKLTAGPDLLLRDPAGQALVVNPQTIAFSDNGDWLAAETLNGSFIRVNLATLDVAAFAPAFGATGSPGLLKSQVAISGDGDYVAINNDDAAVLRLYDLSACDGIMKGLQPQQCAMHDYMPFVRQQITDFHAIRHLRFVDKNLLSFDIRTTGPDGGGLYELAPRESIGPLTDYLALGDSYTSGEGAFDYLSGTDTADNMCHLSANSYPLLLRRALFSSAGGHSVACSGAVINDLASGSSSYRGQVRGVLNFGQLQQSQPALLNSIMAGYLPGYVAQQRFVRQYQPGIMTVSAGGDDVGFGDIVRDCVAPHLGLHDTSNTCYATYEDRFELTQLIDRTIPRWTALYKQLADEDPGGRIYAIGYPQITVDDGNCGLNVHLNKDELTFAEETIDYLDSAIRQASANAGVAYVDVSRALAGHRLCETAGFNVAVNGLTAGSDGSVLGIRVFGKESYHPNALGQALLEQAIIEQTRNLGVAPTVTSDTGGQAILDAPKTGRTINALVPDDKLLPGAVNVGESTALRADGALDGLKASVSYAVRLDGSAGVLLGTVASSANADIVGNITLPAGIPAGGHTVDIIGQGQAGQPVDIRQPVYVTAGSDDSDGDGLADSADSCPGAVDSGHDTDSDGIDDVCDGSIGQPLTIEPGGSKSLGDRGSSNSLQGGAMGSIAGNSLAVSSSAIVTSLLAGRGVDKSFSAAGIVGRVRIGAITASAADFKTLIRPGFGNSPRRLPIGWLVALVLLAGSGLSLILGFGLKRFGGRRGHNALFVPPKALAAVPKTSGFDYNGVMIWLRKGFVHLLALVLLISLVGGVAAMDINRALAPAKLESSLANSKIYDRVTASVLQQAEKSSADGGNSGSVSLSDPLVQQAAEAAFSPSLIEQSVNTFINSNYDWLNGKQSSPDFKIDLSSAKQDFAQQVGQAVQSRLASLPVCSAQQLSQLSIPVDLLSVKCRPSTVDPKSEAAQVAQEVNDSGDFLSNPVITAASLNQNELGQANSTSQGQPYYKKLSWAPKAYRISVKLPWILGGLAILSGLGIFFVSPERRRGVRRIGAVLLVAGIILVAYKLVADAMVNKFAGISIKGAWGSDFKQPISDFLRQLEPQLVANYLLFGIVFIVAAMVIFGLLFKSRQGKNAPPSHGIRSDDSGPQDGSAPVDAGSLRLAPHREPPTSAPEIPGPDSGPSPQPPKPLPPIGKNPPRPRPPRLIQ